MITIKNFLRYGLLLNGLAFGAVVNGQEKLDLSGKWSVALDSLDVGEKQGWSRQYFKQSMHLPGTTDDAGLGTANVLKPALQKPQVSHLTRKHAYLGAAWYSKSIAMPKAWEKKRVILKLERTIWKTNVWIDGQRIELEENSLVAPHFYDITPFLKAGKEQQITIKVDNRKLFDISTDNMGHAYTDHTQIIWNGVIGEISLQVLDQIYVSDLQVFPDLTRKIVKVKAKVQNFDNKAIQGKLNVQIGQEGKNKVYPNKNIVVNPGVTEMEYEYPIVGDVKMWNEFTPDLYTCQVLLKTKNHKSEKNVHFGMREFVSKGNAFELNGMPVFLRGTLECNIFPLTGHPPMDKAGWEKVFLTAKQWGLNHIRFHSWCPPKAAFEVADEIGMYLQVELPVWSLTIGQDASMTAFLYQEASRMIREYGNHPSFMMWSMGNELQGDMKTLNKLVDSLKSVDKRHLYANTSYTFEKGHGDRPEYNDDFLITQYTKDGWVRGQGVFNSKSPAFNTNYEKAVANFQVPIVTHEIGQYAVYPNLKEIDKYTGVLEPINFKAVKNDLEKKGMLGQAAAFTAASGKLAAILYKEEIERALKTGGISGFQLLDLHDFPGQGTALVGLLDAFWDSKGVIDAKTFSQFNAPIVPLLHFPKATYTNSERFEAQIAVSNYGGKIRQNQEIVWRIKDGDNLLKSGAVIGHLANGYNAGLGQLQFDLGEVVVPSKLSVEVELKGTAYTNKWDIWVYPASQKVVYGNVHYTRDMNEAFTLLDQGKKVLLNPEWKKIKGLEGKFVPVFWSPVHFPKQAGTMGMLVDPNHAMFKKFPTDLHTNWQWWDLNINSTTMIVDSLSGGQSVIQMVDNFANNRKLALAYEAKVGQGKLMLVSIDLSQKLDERFVAKQLLVSTLDYMNSNKFNPTAIQNPEQIKELMIKTDKEQLKTDPTSIY